MLSYLSCRALLSVVSSGWAATSLQAAKQSLGHDTYALDTHVFEEKRTSHKLRMSSDTVQDRIPNHARRKKVQLAVDTTQQPVKTPAGPIVTEGGSLRGDGISVGMAGLRVGELSVGGQSSSLSQRQAQRPSNGTVGADGDKLALSEFKTIRVLGEGTSGVVKLVRHRPTERKYAMKVIQLGCSEQERKQILIEVKTLHKSHVPGIIAFSDAFYADNAVHIILEYMDCGSLASVLGRHGPLPEALLARVSKDLLGGLDFLHHELKVIHRDIKPGNVLLNSKGEVKLADFGMSGQLASTFSRLASWVGTAAYMSPERISGSDYSYESDIWAFGAVLWECSVGRYPYTKETERKATTDGGGASLLPEEQKQGLLFWDLLFLIVECPPPPLPEGDFSEALRELVDSCMQSDGSARPSASALLSHRWFAEAGQSQVSIAEWLVPDREP